MTLTPAEALELCTKMRMDLTQLQGRLTDVMEALAAVPSIPDASRKCPTCGITTRGPLALAEHRYTSHGGPVPEHYLQAERLAGITFENFLGETSTRPEPALTDDPSNLMADAIAGKLGTPEEAAARIVYGQTA